MADFLILGQELLAGSYVATELELELRETEILKLKGYISQSVVGGTFIRFRELFAFLGFFENY